MHFVRKDTLAYHKTRPVLVPKDVRLMTCPSVAGRMQQYFNAGPGEASVEEQALIFYMMNHAFAAMLQKFDPNEPLGEANSIANAYVVETSNIAIRMMYYVTLITTRESRHLHGSQSFSEKLAKIYGSTYVNFRNSLSSSSSGAASKFREEPPAMEFGKYTAAVTTVFNEGKFSGGYGGKPWGNIAETLRRMVFGETSPEMFIDTAWTLAHNNGPMFNKGMLYKHYTSDIYKILDVQRSGQIPRLVGQVLNGELSLNGVTSRVKELYLACRKILPDEFSGHVDWYMVEALGAMKSYAQEKAGQVSKHGKPDSVAKMTAEEKKKFYVSPTDFAMKTERKKAA